MVSDTIKKTKKRFDSELHTDEYKNAHSDNDQLNNLLNLMDIENGGTYLDLGTGNGYVGFELATRNKNINLEGLDIASLSMQKNSKIASNKNMDNISFNSYNGSLFPYENENFNGAISRYALHHFPQIKKSINEINRVLKPTGYFVLSDPLTFDDDNFKFIDKFQDLKNDGHIHFYYEKEITKIFNELGFQKENQFYSSFTITRKYEQNYKELIEKTPKKILDIYNAKINDNKISVTIKILNILFRKDKSGLE